MFDYKLLEALAMVVQEGGFERAARALFLTQSAVSQRIKLLEDEVGQILVVRETPPTATPAGRALIRHYRQVALLERGLVESLSTVGSSRRAPLRLAVNEDSLSTWFIEALSPFLRRESVLLDLRVDDEEQTHRLLRDGEVIGCVSARARPMQGCRVEALGHMRHRLLASPAFAEQWFPEGLTVDAIERAPLLVFHREDALHEPLLRAALGEEGQARALHYVPSVEQGAVLISSGLACGMLSDFMSRSHRARGLMVDLAPPLYVDVHLYWHCWNLDAPLLQRLTDTLVGNARQLLSGPRAADPPAEE